MQNESQYDDAFLLRSLISFFFNYCHIHCFSN